MNDTNYTVDILVNEKPIRKYPFENKLFVEARAGQEYSIRIKNNTWERILSVTSIDGLDSLNGKAAIENGNGYVINGYGSLNLDGFRISDEKVARFVFSQKDSSYAVSKGNDAEKNVGVIGLRIFTEKVKPQPNITEIHHYHNNRRIPYNTPGIPSYPPIIWCDTTANTICSNNNLMDDFTANYSCNSIPTKGNVPINSKNLKRSICSNEPLRGFDMGTKYGSSKESTVIEVEFEKGILALSTNIYYASRQSLIEMGVKLNSEKQVSFPEPFKDSKYSQPPKGWTD